jgi:4-oxalmesaconate hydratase
VRGADPQTGYDFDDTKRYVDHAPGLSAEDKKKIFEGNAMRAYPRLKRKLEQRSSGKR